MEPYIVKMSSKGQITIPVEARKHFKLRQCLLEVRGKTIILKPVKFKVIGDKANDDLENFGSLATSSFNELWNNSEDDVYQEFYINNKTT